VNHKKLLFCWNFYHGECLVLLDFLQFSCFDDRSLGPGCTSTVISCCVYNLLLALEFLLFSVIIYFQLLINCTSGRVHVNLCLDFSRAYPKRN